MFKLFQAKIRLIIATAFIIGPAPVASADVFMSMFNSANTAAINISNTIGLNAAIKNSAKKRGTTPATKRLASPVARLQRLSFIDRHHPYPISLGSVFGIKLRPTILRRPKKLTPLSNIKMLWANLT